VTTVRSEAKGEQILVAHAGVSREQLSYVVVPDIALEGAFDNVSNWFDFCHHRQDYPWKNKADRLRAILQAVKSNPPFEYVIHTASPFHHNFDDPVKGLLEPAINGTTGILRAIKAFAPEVKRVVVTSSFAAIVNPASPSKVYDETSWNPVTWKEATTQRPFAYRGSKVRILFL
jgi:nucleoside-diphosphate-sugar epimerase